MTSTAGLATQDPMIDSTRAWTCAVAVSAANGVGFGTAYTFGTFFDPMATEFGADKGSTALIFGVTLLFFFGFGIVSGPISDRHGPRPLLIAGGLTMVTGLLITSQANGLALGIVSYGIGVGVGGGLFVAPLNASIGTLFDRKRPAAFSVIAVGNGVGVVVLVPLSESLISAYDWRRAYLVLAGIAAVTFTLSAFVIVSRPAVSTGSPQTTRQFLANRGFVLLFTVGVLMSVGLFIAFAFIQTFAVDDGVSVATAARLVSLIGLSSIVGRIGLTALVKPFGAMTVLRLALGVQCAAYVLWFFAGGNVGLLVAFVLLFGSAYGGFVAVIPEAGIGVVGLADLGKSLGLLFLSFGIGGLIGPPLAGWLAEATTSNDVPILLSVGLLAAATLLASFVRSPDID